VEIILATTNSAKVRALAERVSPRVSVAALPETTTERHTPDELVLGSSFEEVAAAKAIWYSRHIPDCVIAASDGGLLVPALKGSWDALHTARYAGIGNERAAGVGLLLERARRLSPGERRIGWTEALAVARDGDLLTSWVANSPPGELAVDLPPDFDPTAGFWVPFVWRCPEYDGRRLAELTEHERLARRDHWAILGDCITEWATGLNSTAVQ
jgi:inosine/xanthosine triphosphate pyrophosphatase family protein